MRNFTIDEIGKIIDELREQGYIALYANSENFIELNSNSISSILNGDDKPAIFRIDFNKCEGIPRNNKLLSDGTIAFAQAIKSFEAGFDSNRYVISEYTMRGSLDIQTAFHHKTKSWKDYATVEELAKIQELNNMHGKFLDLSITMIALMFILGVLCFFEFVSGATTFLLILISIVVMVIATNLAPEYHREASVIRDKISKRAINQRLTCHD